jgi:hypothetical protein
MFSIDAEVRGSSPYLARQTVRFASICRLFYVGTVLPWADFPSWESQQACRKFGATGQEARTEERSPLSLQLSRILQRLPYPDSE